MPAIGLFLLAPWVGEYLLGNVPGQAILLLPFLAPLYGGGALLIREIARRTGHGWPTILILGAAYGVIEAGLVDQSLFNPTFGGHDFQAVTPVPALGISANNTLSFVIGHAVWSIGIPIAIVEMLTRGRRTTPRSHTPWLGTFGLTVTVLLYLLGCWIIFDDLRTSEDFMASPAQLAGAATVAVALIVTAFLVPRRPVPALAPTRVPKPWALGVGAFLYSGIFFARPENWYGVAMAVVMVPVAAVAIRRWSRQERWTGRHRFALVAGTLPTYAWGGFVLTMLFDPDDHVRYLFNGVFAILAILLLVWAGRRVRRGVPPG